MQKPPKVLLAFDFGLVESIDQDFSEQLRTEDWKTERHVIEALKKLKYPHEMVALHDDTEFLSRKIEAAQPDVIFNMVEQFGSSSNAEYRITSFLELQGIPFTGCGSTGITLCKNKSISKKILSYHRIRVPEFAVFPVARRWKRPRRLKLPLLVKPLREEASYGIAQASYVESDEEFQKRVRFIHERFQQPAIAEEFIHGREIYAGVMGQHRLQVFPLREMRFDKVPEDEPRIATFRVKWDAGYRDRWGIDTHFVEDLPPDLYRRIERTVKRIYRLLLIDGYARLDFRLTPENEIVFIEANPNPMLARDEDFALAAEKAGLDYPRLIRRIIQQGLAAERD